MELALFVEPQLGASYERLVELARWAEDFGLDSFARSDHYMHNEVSENATDALVSLAGVAAATNRIRLNTLVSPITFRHPAVMAKSATTLDEISSGRFTLGVGAGWMASEHAAFGMDLPPVGERFDRLAEALAYIRAVFDGGGTVSGDYYSLDAASISPKASDGLKIVVGGGGRRRTPTLVGQYADEYNLFVTDPESLLARVAVMRGAAEAVGRNPDEILISIGGPAWIFEAEADHRALLEERGAKKGMSADEYAAFLDVRNIPHGTPEHAHQAIERMADLGVGRYYLQEFRPMGDIDLDRMELVFSALRGD